PVELWFDESGRTDGAPGFGDVFDEAHALHSILGDIYDYWRGLLFLDSFDGRGAPLRGVVNFRDTITLSLTSNAWHFAIPPGPPTPEFPVAYDRTVLAFDPGMVVRDIVMHEYTHALTHHLSISKLHGEGQPASLNEAIGDMFAAFLGGDGSTWNIGEDSVISTMRSLSDPHSLPGRDWAPSCWAERFGGTEPTPECAGVSCAAGQACFIGTCIPTTHDDGGEHINATIVGHAMYLASEGSASAVDAGAGCDSEIEVRPLGTEKVQLFAATALLLVQRTTTFADHRENMDASCRLMAHHRVTPLGASSPVVDQDCISLRNAFARVGIGAADRDYDGVLDPLDACPEDPTQSEAGSDCADEPTDPPLAALDITVCQWQRHRVVGDGTFEDDFCDYDPSRPQTPGCDLRGGAPIRVGGSPTHPAFEAVDRVGFNNFTLVHRAGGSTRSFVIHATDPGAWLPERIVHGEYPTGTAPGWSFEGGSGMSDDNPLSPSGPSMHSATFRRPEIEGEISDVSVSFMLGSGRDCSMAE
ncbi:MAG: M4 family metallopeptidase, partial [Sandaracinaceae bacterium]